MPRLQRGVEFTDPMSLLLRYCGRNRLKLLTSKGVGFTNMRIAMDGGGGVGGGGNATHRQAYISRTEDGIVYREQRLDATVFTKHDGETEGEPCESAEQRASRCLLGMMLGETPYVRLGESREGMDDLILELEKLPSNPFELAVTLDAEGAVRRCAVVETA